MRPCNAARGCGKIIAVVGDRLPVYPDVPTMTEQGAVGGSYETRASAAFAVPSATPKEIAKKLSDTLIEAGTDEKVKQLLANYLIAGPLSAEATNARFKRDTAVRMEVLKEIALKPEQGAGSVDRVHQGVDHVLASRRVRLGSQTAAIR